MDRSILVAGGTGTLGRAVVDGLLATLDTDAPVRVLSRGRRPHAPTDRVRHVVGDVRTGAGLAEALTGVTTVVACVDPLDQLVAAALRAGRPHLVYISIVGIDRVPLRYYRRKLADERLLAGSGLPASVLRTTQFHDLVAAALRVAATPPVMVVPAGWSFQPIDVRDVAARLAELALGEPAGRVPDMGGPQVLGIVELARRYLAATGKRRPVVSVPVPGRVAAGYRAGAHCCPDRAVGTIPFDQYLAELSAGARQPYAGLIRANLRLPHRGGGADAPGAE